MSHVIVTSREELTAIMATVLRQELSSLVRDMDKQKAKPSMTPQEAADYLGQSVNTLRQWRNQGRGPAYERRGRNIRYNLEDLEVWKQANRVITGEALESINAGRRADQLFRGVGVTRG